MLRPFPRTRSARAFSRVCGGLGLRTASFLQLFRILGLRICSKSALGSLLGAAWRHHRPPLGLLGCFGPLLKPLRSLPGASWEAFGAALTLFGAARELLEGLLGASGSVSERSWGRFDQKFRNIDRVIVFEAFSRLCEASWGSVFELWGFEGARRASDLEHF